MKLASFLESMEISTKDDAQLSKCKCVRGCRMLSSAVNKIPRLLRVECRKPEHKVWTLFRIIDNDQSGLIDLEDDCATNMTN